MRSSILLFFALNTQSAIGQDLAKFVNQTLNLGFEHPKTWKASKPRRGQQQFLIPLSGDKTAELQISEATFVSPKEAWLESQRKFMENEKRVLVRQWEEEILGVPLLLTTATSTVEGVPTSVTIGLLFSKTNRKLLYRLTGPTDQFEQAQAEWRTAMQTLRTLDGSPAEVEDPSRLDGLPRGKDGRRNLNSDRRATLSDSNPTGPNRRKVEIAPVIVAATSGGKNVQIRLPKDWTAEAGERGVFTLKHPKLVGSLRLQVLSTLDSDPGLRAYVRQMGDNLGKFSLVSSREEQTSLQANLADAQIAYLWRFGPVATASAAPGPGVAAELATLDAICLKGEHYGLLSFETNGKPSTLRVQRDVLSELLQKMSLELAP